MNSQIVQRTTTDSSSCKYDARAAANVASPTTTTTTTTTTIPHADDDTTDVYQALLDPQRIEALHRCDRNVVFYDPNSFWMVFRFRGRHFGMIVQPLMALIVWDVFWALFWISHPTTLSNALLEPFQSLEPLISPLMVPVSFLLVFRLGRAGVRYWDARAAMGKLIEVCRTMASTALLGLSTPTRSSNSIGTHGNGGGGGEAATAAAITSNINLQRQQQQFAHDFCRWIAVFPISVKNFLREGKECNRALEIGNLLSFHDSKNFLEASTGPDKVAPILVLNELRKLAFDAAATASTQQQRDATIAALWLRQLNEQIDILTGTWGGMERIQGTPLPFVYVVHLRTFLMLYLLLWHMEAIASQGWIALLPLLLASWGLLGIEAAAVECERPFWWHSNHLALGRMGVVVAKNVAQTMEQAGWTTNPAKEHAKRTK